MFPESSSYFEETDKYFCDLILNQPQPVPVVEEQPTPPMVYGRWSYHENQTYLTALEQLDAASEVDPLFALKKALPARSEFQIKAHHMKMLRRYRTTDNIVSHLNHPNNQALLEIAERLKTCEGTAREMGREVKREQ